MIIWSRWKRIWKEESEYEMEQVVPQEKQSLSGKNIILVVGTLLVVGLIAIMAVNLHKGESTDLSKHSIGNIAVQDVAG